VADSFEQLVSLFAGAAELIERGIRLIGPGYEKIQQLGDTAKSAAQFATLTAAPSPSCR
jgi:hypothetical protein